MNENPASFEVTSWENVREDFKKANPKVAAIIDRLSPGKRFPLVRARYPFGATIASEGEIYIPSQNGTTQPLSSMPEILKLLKPNSSDKNIPVMFILQNSAEIFYEMTGRIISAFLSTPGKFIGLWDQLGPVNQPYVKWVWNLVAGARTLYMLPKITNVAGHKVLRKKYCVSSHAPKSYNEHWKIFKEIANSDEFPQDWYSEILFFSDLWLETARKDPAWRELYDHLLSEVWDEIGYWRSELTFKVIWENYLSRVMDVNVRPNLYLACIVKQLMLAGIGILPILTVATDDIAAPINDLQRVYIEDYRLKGYTPIFMHSHIFKPTDQYPVYYSLSQPNLLETVPITQNMPSILGSIPEIKYLLELLKNESLVNHTTKDTPIYDFFKNVQVDYFHNQEQKHNHIQSTCKLAEEDDRFKLSLKHRKNSRFPEASSVINGCIRLKNIVPRETEK